jgi:hypothetical protein
MDRRVRPDLVPGPDAVPWICRRDADCDDRLGCTSDRCTQRKQCLNSLRPGFCLIGAACYAVNQTAPGNVCAVCDPSTSTSGWTARADGVPCESDGLRCTQDSCKGGKCTHPLTTGCLIGGRCIPETAVDPTDNCSFCLPARSTTAYTYAAGSPCSPSPG